MVIYSTRLGILARVKKQGINTPLVAFYRNEHKDGVSIYSRPRLIAISINTFPSLKELQIIEEKRRPRADLANIANGIWVTSATTKGTNHNTITAIRGVICNANPVNKITSMLNLDLDFVIRLTSRPVEQIQITGMLAHIYILIIYFKMYQRQFENLHILTRTTNY